MKCNKHPVDELRSWRGGYCFPSRSSYDVENSISGVMRFWALRGKGVPVSALGPDIVYGYDIEKINQSLVRLGYRINGVQRGNALDQAAVFDGEQAKRSGPESIQSG